jgi:hypothetical protein
MAKIQMRRVRGKPWSKTKEIPLTPSTLRRLGYAIVKELKREAAKDFAKRGWSGEDPMGGKPIWESFHFSVRGQDVIVYSTFYGMKELAKGDIPARKMTWLTQKAKEEHPSQYALTDREKELGMRVTGKPSKGERLPLIVPVESNGSVVFRVAPLRFADAWVHPGIAKFTFFGRAIRKGREACMEIIAEEIAKALAEGDPTR